MNAEAGLAADRIARRGCNNPFAIRIPIVIEGESEQSYLLWVLELRLLLFYRGIWQLCEFAKKRRRFLPKFELTKLQNGGIITLLSNAARRYGSGTAS